jgi:hypothetical protein
MFTWLSIIRQRSREHFNLLILRSCDFSNFVTFRVEDSLKLMHMHCNMEEFLRYIKYHSYMWCAFVGVDSISIYLLSMNHVQVISIPLIWKQSNYKQMRSSYNNERRNTSTACQKTLVKIYNNSKQCKQSQ